MEISGNYQQMSAFVGGLDSFPRLFVIHTFTLSFGPPTSGATASVSATGASNVAAGENAPSLWVGGTPTAGSAGPYTLSLSGQIYYTSTANATAACTAATTAAAK